MRLDSVVKDLQRERLELESKLKQVNVARPALAKLNSKPQNQRSTTIQRSAQHHQPQL